MPILGAARTAMDEDAFRRMVRDALAKRAPDTVASGAADRLLARTVYLAVDVTKPEELKSLGERMAELNVKRPLYYLSVSPSLYSAICQGLLAAGLTDTTARGW